MYANECIDEILLRFILLVYTYIDRIQRFKDILEESYLKMYVTEVLS